MNLTNVSKEFLNLILTFLFQLLSKFDPQLRRPTPPSNEDADPEVAAQPDGNDTVDQLQAPDEPAEPGNGFDPDTPELVVEHRNNNLNNAMVAFCFASSMAIALLPIQVHSQLHSSLLWLALAVLLGFTSFFLSEFIDSRGRSDGWTWWRREEKWSGFTFRCPLSVRRKNCLGFEKMMSKRNVP
ncbi:hypothetical protein CFP56_006973 [Quercus suber]|uniref:Uncharacterized protein n=1 Tax=Quercus suber TaxID=58331 RepID=A0AAW0L781_QUESU